MVTDDDVVSGAVGRSFMTPGERRGGWRRAPTYAGGTLTTFRLTAFPAELGVGHLPPQLRFRRVVGGVATCPTPHWYGGHPEQTHDTCGARAHHPSWGD